MTEPLFEFLRNPAPLSLPSMLVGDTVFLIVAGLTLFALLALPLARGLGLSVGAVRWLAHRVVTFGAARPVLEPNRPLHVDGLSPALVRLARQTRTLALELRRRSEEARHWPEDAGELALASVHGRWWGSFVSDPFDMRPLLDTRRDVWDWLDSVAQLPAGDRERLEQLGIRPDSVREAVTAERSIADCVGALAGLLWAADERLGTADSRGYRATGAESHGHVSASPSGPTPEPSDSEVDAEDARRRRFACVVSSQRGGFSHVAASWFRPPRPVWHFARARSATSWVGCFALRLGGLVCVRRVVASVEGREAPDPRRSQPSPDRAVCSQPPA